MKWITLLIGLFVGVGFWMLMYGHGFIFRDSSWEEKPVGKISLPTNKTIQTLPYYERAIKGGCDSTAPSIEVKILLAESKKSYPPVDLAATCVAAAKYYQRKYRAAHTQVRIYGTLELSRFTRLRMADCSYLTYDNRKAEEWQHIWVDPLSPDSPENRARRLYSLRSKSRRDDHKLRDTIAEELGIPVETVWNATWSSPKLFSVSPKALKNIGAAAPLPPNKEALAKNNKQIREASEDL